MRGIVVHRTVSPSGAASSWLTREFQSCPIKSQSGDRSEGNG